MGLRPVMTIGGSDPSGGAGIQTDIKAFQSLKLHPISIITCITVQNTRTVKNIIPLQPSIIRNQIETIMEDIPVQYVKTGMIYKVQSAKEIVKEYNKFNWDLIVDPVFSSTSGNSLSSIEYMANFSKTLLPISQIITPNIPEAEALANIHINTLDDMKCAAKKIFTLGAKNVIVKGGHLEGPIAYDVLYNGSAYKVLSLPKLLKKKAHGSGCTFSALLTGFLAKGSSLESAFQQAKRSLWHMIFTGYNIGKGSDVLSVSNTVVQDAPMRFQTVNHFETWKQLYKIVPSVEKRLPIEFIPEVGCNIGYALPNAKTAYNVCAIDGRIVKTAKGPRRCGSFEFGASKHIASVILATMKKHPMNRSAMNIKYSPIILSLCKKLDYKIASFDREAEPAHNVSTMEWGVTNVLNTIDICPDIIYDLGSIGKEPMIRVLGTDPKNVLKKIYNISNLIR